MTTTIVFSETTDGYVQSEDASYATALAGDSFVVNTAGTAAFFGQSGSFGQGFGVWQGFVDFDGSAVAADLLAAAGYVRLKLAVTNGTSVFRDLELREFDWGASLTSTDWRTPTQLSALTLESLVAVVQNAGTERVRLGQETGISPGNSYVVNSSRNRRQNTPTIDEFSAFSTADASGTSSDPALYYTTVPESDLLGVLGAQVQLSDGTHAFLQADPSNTDVLLRHRTSGGTVTTIATLAMGSPEFSSPWSLGAQAMTLVVDNDDNLYVLGRAASALTPNHLAARAYAKGVGHSWSEGTFRTAALPSYDGDINNIAAAWHNEGTGGTIVAIVSHNAARNTDTDVAYALLNCNFLLTGSGSLLRASGDATSSLVEGDFPSGFNNFTNETGSLLDVCAAPGVTNRGFVACARNFDELGKTNAGVVQARYQLASGGTSFADINRWSTVVFSAKDANAKSRLIAISTSQYVVVAPYISGFLLRHAQNIGTSATFTSLAIVDLEEDGPASMPAASTLATSQLWDVVYDPDSNQVWVYYFDTADDQRLMRTHVDLNTGQAAADEVQVDAAVGASGSTNHAIRVHRGAMNSSQALISVANETSGGTHSTIYVADTLNVAPTAPTLTPEPNFDATTERVFEWTFNDPNSGDTQSAYELEINTSAGASAVDTGKVTSATSNHTLAASSLTNLGDWQWRVRTWDAADAEGAWSDFGTFVTSASGAVTIIDPASDNPAGVNVDSYLIEWTVSGTTQDDYRVTMTRTDTEVEVLDTDWVNSTDTTFEVTGMLSDVEYRIEVTVRDASDIETNTDSVLITPDYDSPQTPTVAVSVVDADGYILITVTNPAPEGDEPNADHNDILRRIFNELTDEAYLKIGECEENGSFRDYTAASGVTYEYVARAQSDPS